MVTRRRINLLSIKMELRLASLKDLVKAALVKKNGDQQVFSADPRLDSGKTAPKPQVASNKPAKKSAGRGR